MQYQADDMVAVTTIFVGSIPFINAKGPINQPEQYLFESVNAAIRQGYPLKIVKVEAQVDEQADEVARQAAAAEAERVAQEAAAKKAKEDEAAAEAARLEAEKKAALEAAAKKAQVAAPVKK